MLHTLGISVIALYFFFKVCIALRTKLVIHNCFKTLIIYFNLTNIKCNHLSLILYANERLVLLTSMLQCIKYYLFIYLFMELANRDIGILIIATLTAEILVCLSVLFVF